MRVLLLNQFYPPDVAPTGQALQDLARALRARGHEVQVLHSRAAYGTSTSSTAQARKALDYATFGVRLVLASRTVSRPDVIVSLTTPPYLGLLCSVVPGWRGVARVEWIMDVYPDVLAAHGALRRGGAVFRLLERVSRRQLRGASAVIALGPFMARVLESRLEDRARLTAIPLWGEDPTAAVPAEEAHALRRSRGWEAGEPVLLYSGNMGRGHRLSEFLEAAAQLGARGPRWAFAGGGARRAEGEAFARARPGARIQLLPYVPRERLRASLAAADVHLASLSAAWQGLIVPSKVQAAFAVGRPVIFVGPRENESAAWIEESGGGWVVGEGDVPALLAAVEQAADAGERERRGEAGRAFARAHFHPPRNTERIVEIIERAGPR